MPISVGEGSGRLVAHRRVLCLPAEAAERELARPVVAHDCRLAGNAVAIAIVGIGVREDIGVGNGLDQAKPEHRRGDARRKRRVGIERAIGEVGGRIAAACAARRSRRRQG